MAKRVPREIWDKYIEKAVADKVSIREIEGKLRTTPSYFRKKVEQTKGVKVYACQRGYLSVTKSSIDCQLVDKRLTSMSSGFLKSRQSNQCRLFDMLGLSRKDIEAKVLKDPLYIMAMNRLNTL